MSSDHTVAPEDMDLVEKCDPETKLAVTAWVFKHILEHATEGGSYRYLIYHRLGFGPEAYVPLYEAGGMEISNEFDLSIKKIMKDTVKENKYEKMKVHFGLCDEPGCYEETCCGFPTPDGYRTTCSKHKI